jgi:AcrR family transcriptional regulator
MADHDRQPTAQPLSRAREGVTETGRVNQKLRTRQALVDAATDLMAAGASPTLAEVAEHALVSKTTAYRYFASAEALIEEVFFDREFPTVEQVLGTVGDDPTTRVLAVEEAVNDTLLEHEHAMRVIVRNALDVALSAGDDAPLRVGRRLMLITAALEPLEGELEPDVLERLRDALALVIGPEAIVAARDICGLDVVDTRKVTRWATEALVAHALAESALSATPHRRGTAR